jgi:uncharacterized membrane protein
MNRIDWWHVAGLVAGLIAALVVAFGLWVLMIYVMTAFKAPG